MRILIVGAGAVGGFFGAHLLAAHRDVTFLVRPARAQKLADNGLHLLTPTGDIHIPTPPTITADQLSTPFDLILLSCKAWDLAGAMNDFAPAVGPHTAILPLLNGMRHMDTLDQRFTRANVLGGATTISTVLAPDGRIRQLNPLDLLQFGDRDQPDSPRMHAILEALTVPGINPQLRPAIIPDMWQKWVTISTAAGITCLMRAPVGDFVAAGASNLAQQLLAETASIATAAGFPPAQPFLDALATRLTEPHSAFTASMLRDLEAGNPIEAQTIIGDLLAHAHRLHVPTPLLEVVFAHLRTYEERRTREHTTPK